MKQPNVTTNEKIAIGLNDPWRAIGTMIMNVAIVKNPRTTELNKYIDDTLLGLFPKPRTIWRTSIRRNMNSNTIAQALERLS
jgi:hypothetical protein